MTHTVDHFFAATRDVLLQIQACEDINYPLCKDHRKLYRLPISLDLRELDCDTQPCRATCPFNLMEAKTGMVC